MLNPYKSLLPSTVGFDRLLSTFDEFENILNEGKKVTQTYPPYNIIKTDEHNYAIEIAVAGFKTNELDVSFANNKLTVTGSTSEDKRNYLHKGIGTRNFVHNFTISDTVVIGDASVQDGLLTISLQNVIPDEKKPRKIPIRE